MTFSPFKSPVLPPLSTQSPFPQMVITPVLLNHGLLLHNILLSELFPVLMSACSFSTCGLVLSESVSIYGFIYISSFYVIMFVFHFSLFQCGEKRQGCSLVSSPSSFTSTTICCSRG